MSQELTILSAANIDATTFQVDTAAIKADVEMWGKMTIAGIEDKEGYRRVQEGRLLLKKVRTGIEQRRKELKAGALEYGRKVDAVAKELTALIEPTEEKLGAISSEHLAALEAIEIQKLDERMAKLAAIGDTSSRIAVRAMSDKMFDECLAFATAEHSKRVEAARVAEEERQKAEADAAEARRLEAEKLKADREALELERKQLADRRAQEQAELKAEQARINADRKEVERLRNEEADRLQAQRDEIARQQAEIDAANALRDGALRQQVEADLAQAEAEERARIAEELKPDREKLVKFIDKLAKLPSPKLETEAGKALMDRINNELGELVYAFYAQVEALGPVASQEPQA